MGETAAASSRLYSMMPIWPGKTDPRIRWLYPDGELGWMREVPAGPIAHPGGQAYQPGTGFPEGFAPPVLLAPRKARSATRPGLAIADIDGSAGSRFWVVSDRARSFFLASDPEAFRFHPLDIALDDGGPYDGPRYWLCDVVRYLDALDHDRTQCVQSEYPGMRFVEPSPFGKVYVRRDMVGEAQIFRPLLSHKIYCSGDFRDRFKASGLIGGFAAVGVISGDQPALTRTA